MANTASINLLRSSKGHFWDKVLPWALTTGRFLIILTETIALSAFVYRFTLDRQIVDLADSIKENQTLVSYYKDTEPLYRNLQERLTYAATLSETNGEKILQLEDLYDIASGNVVYQSVSIDNNALSVQATAFTPGGLSAFLAEFKQLPLVKSVSIDRIENQAASGAILVTLTAQLTTASQEEVPSNERN